MNPIPILTWYDLFWLAGIGLIYWVGYKRGRKAEKAERDFITRVVNRTMERLKERGEVHTRTTEGDGD